MGGSRIQVEVKPADQLDHLLSFRVPEGGLFSWLQIPDWLTIFYCFGLAAARIHIV